MSNVNLSQIQYIFDIDGFAVSDCPTTKYLTKELAVFNFSTLTAMLFRFRLHRSKKSLKSKDFETAKYCQRKIHGLLFRDFRNDLNQKLVPHIVQRLVNQCNNTGKYIGYKGGHLEHDLLVAAKAKYIINIERLGTPKYDTIRKQIECQQLASTFDRKISRSPYTKCRRHQGPNAHKYHCPLEEICVFAAWLINNHS
jgi:hypothetical protein